ncbi:hypothetical protein Cgig2_028183 [Carnegiea gigantea]|uniref:Uncharacterized protein n=1 Tax=Carnegiea gigantea TaxID=171969 RepID=A0A9Q1JHR5_9CARY|nr:hypothetical protein Cgig2_028183 [Carnegiea gigantea]
MGVDDLGIRSSPSYPRSGPNFDLVRSSLLNFIPNRSLVQAGPDRTGPAWIGPDRGFSVRSSVLSFPVFGLRSGPVLDRVDRLVDQTDRFYSSSFSSVPFSSATLLDSRCSALAGRRQLQLLLAFFSLTHAHLLSSALLLLLNPDLLSVFVQLVERILGSIFVLPSFVIQCLKLLGAMAVNFWASSHRFQAHQDANVWSRSGPIRSGLGPTPDRSGPRSKVWQIFSPRSSRSGPVRSDPGPMNTPNPNLLLSLSKTLTSIVEFEIVEKEKVALDSISTLKKAIKSKGSFICSQTSTMGKKKVCGSSQAPSLPKKSSRPPSSSNAPSGTKGTKDVYPLILARSTRGLVFVNEE